MNTSTSTVITSKKEEQKQIPITSSRSKMSTLKQTGLPFSLKRKEHNSETILSIDNDNVRDLFQE